MSIERHRSESVGEEPVLPEGPAEELKLDELESFYAQIDELNQQARLALYDKQDWIFKDLHKEIDGLQYKLDTYFTETQLDTEEMKQSLQERARQKSQVNSYGDPQIRGRIREIERQIVIKRNG